MKNLKKFLRYVTAKDLFEDLKLYKKLEPVLAKESHDFKPRTLINKILHVSGRYTPSILEIDGIRRIVDGQTSIGAIELFIGEFYRWGGYLKTLEKRRISKSLYKLSSSEKEEKKE